MRKVLYVENYIRVDFDGDGIAELRKICTAGDGTRILSNEPCAMAPFATFCPGCRGARLLRIVSWLTQCMDIQRIKSSIMRNTLDSLSQSINPRLLSSRAWSTSTTHVDRDGRDHPSAAAGQIQPNEHPVCRSGRASQSYNTWTRSRRPAQASPRRPWVSTLAALQAALPAL